MVLDQLPCILCMVDCVRKFLIGCFHVVFVSGESLSYCSVVFFAVRILLFALLSKDISSFKGCSQEFGGNLHCF